MTAQTDYQAFLDAQAVVGYTLGDIEGSADADMLKYTELKIAASQEVTKISDFGVAKQAAIQALQTEQAGAMQVLYSEWQLKEDNDYDVDYVAE